MARPRLKSNVSLNVNKTNTSIPQIINVKAAQSHANKDAKMPRLAMAATMDWFQPKCLKTDVMMLVQKVQWRIQCLIQINAKSAAWAAKSARIQVPALFVKTDS